MASCSELGLESCVVWWVDRCSPYVEKERGLFDAVARVRVEFDGLDKATRIAEQFASAMDVHDGDIVLGQAFPQIAAVIAALSRRAAVRHVEVLHGDADQYYKLARLIARCCDGFLVPSTRIERRLREIVGPDVPVALAPPGVEDCNPPARGAAGPLRVCFVGRLSPEKNVGTILEAVAELQHEGEAMSLVLAGGGALESKVRDCTERLGLLDTELLGPIPRAKVGEVYARSDVLVLASDYEGFPVVVAEAMTAGLVPVCTRVSGCEDAIDQGVDGLLYEPGDRAALVTHLRALAADRPRLTQMSKNAVRKARSFSRAARAVRTVEFLRGLPECSYRGTAQLRLLDHHFVPNVVARLVRRGWRLLRGRPADAMPRAKETHGES